MEEPVGIDHNHCLSHFPQLTYASRTAQKQDNNETLDQGAEDVEQEKLEDSHKDEAKLQSPEKNADSLEAQLEDAQAKATENWESYLRAKAEMDNLRRRNTKDVENAHKYGIEKFVTELLPVLDSMVMGLATEDASAESLREGMELTKSMLDKMMEKLAIEEIDPLNEKFDAAKPFTVKLPLPIGSSSMLNITLS